MMIGYDHPAPPQQTNIEKQQAEDWLYSDITSAKTHLLSESPSISTISAHRRAALISFVFNLGIGRYRSSTLKRKVDTGDWEGAKREIVKWVNGGGKRLPGLIARRAEEALFLDIE
jgi:GH24 family phage-related lysozyme (muramidase)